MLSQRLIPAALLEFVSVITLFDQHFASQSFGSRCLLVPAPLQIIILF
jgi:hypothetical protein